MTKTGSDSLLSDIERFLYREARLLDERRYHDWLALFTDDTHYWMPTLSNRFLGEIDREISTTTELAYFNDDLNMLRARIARLDSGMAWSEDPPSRTVHVVTNIEVSDVQDTELDVSSAFVLYRNRLETETDILVGRRYDRLRRVDAEWRIARRKIVLAQNVLLSKNLSMFF